MNTISEDPTATALDEKRERIRVWGKRLTFDCYNCITKPASSLDSRGRFHKEPWVVCKLGMPLRGCHTLSLSTILRGYASPRCQNCGHYNNGENRANR